MIFTDAYIIKCIKKEGMVFQLFNLIKSFIIKEKCNCSLRMRDAKGKFMHKMYCARTKFHFGACKDQSGAQFNT
jgi:ABC-type lipoprotein export system ATPase subunit